jgi:hypothetical protein
MQLRAHLRGLAGGINVRDVAGGQKLVETDGDLESIVVQVYPANQSSGNYILEKAQ